MASFPAVKVCELRSSNERMIVDVLITEMISRLDTLSPRDQRTAFSGLMLLQRRLLTAREAMKSSVDGRDAVAMLPTISAGLTALLHLRTRDLEAIAAKKAAAAAAKLARQS
jgi:hypothetical protein